MNGRGRRKRLAEMGSIGQIVKSKKAKFCKGEAETLPQLKPEPILLQLGHGARRALSRQRICSKL